MSNNGKTFLLQPFDLMLHATEEGVAALQSRFSTWLRTLNSPARFVCWQMPATLDDKIESIVQTANTTDDTQRRSLLMEYRRHYEGLQDNAEYNRTLCGIALWSEQNSRALKGGMISAFDTPVTEGKWLPLFEGHYELRESPFWHLAPVGRPGGRPLWTMLSSYEFVPASWNFFRPLPSLLWMNFPMAIVVDIPKTFDRNTGIDTIERIIGAYNVHLATVRGEDTRSVQRVTDCHRALHEIHQGDALHLAQITLTIAADDLPTLKERMQAVINETKAWFSLREEVGELLGRSPDLFAPKATSDVNLPDTTWPVTSRELSLMFSPLGYRKLSSTDGVLRGEAVGAYYPVFHNSWRDKRATHEIWVGSSGYGKTFAVNCYLTREYAENGIPFDLLEPMGHGKHIADAFGLPWYVLSARHTQLNPQDVMFPTLIEQINHTIRIYETVMGRLLSGGQRQNVERGLLSEALQLLYRGFPDLNRVTPEITPTCDVVCDVLSGLGDKEVTREVARNLADEIGRLCTGSGPWAGFLNGTTNIDLTRGGREWIRPRVFSFHDLEGDPILQALAYTQVLSAIRRDSLIDEQPRIIAVDEVYRLMRHPSLLDFLIEAAKTFRTRRVKLLAIDQQMSVFLQNKARLVFENCPIRVIFSQRQGMNVFHEDAAFAHFNAHHRDIIAALPRFHYLLDIQDEGLWQLYMRPSEGELYRFKTT
jgi:Cdc6-like AAA superfamily ATPase